MAADHDDELARLRAENAGLAGLLEAHGIAWCPLPRQVTHHLPPHCWPQTRRPPSSDGCPAVALRLVATAASSISSSVAPGTTCAVQSCASVWRRIPSELVQPQRGQAISVADSG